MSSYKLASFESKDGARAGMVVDDRVSDIAAFSGREDYATMLGVLADWPNADKMLCRAAEDRATTGGMPLAQLRLLAPLPKPGVIYCAGSYHRHHPPDVSTLHQPPVR